MIESLADIEALTNRCNSEQSKDYVIEAIKSYQAGAYRAAIVTTWIAVVFDLLDKIRELSIAGNGTAKDIYEEYEHNFNQIERKDPKAFKIALEFERNIIQKCHDNLQFFDQQQFLELERLREDRHRCAHPTFQQIGIPFSPSAELARLHIRNAIFYVLSQPPIQGKSALTGLRTLINSAYFPLELTQAKIQLEKSHLRNGTESLKNAFTDELIYGYFNKEDLYHLKDQVCSALNAIHEISPELAENRLARSINKIFKSLTDEKLKEFCRFISKVTFSKRSIDDENLSKISSYIKSAPLSEINELLEVLSKDETFKNEVSERVNKMTFEELSNAINNHQLIGLAKEPALQHLSRVTSIHEAGTVFYFLINPLFKYLTREDIERIIRMPTETGAALIGINQYRFFIDKVRDDSIIPRDELIKLLNENNATHVTQI